MSIDFSELALVIIVLFGLFGWLRGIRRVAITTGGVFFAMVVVSLIGADLIRSLTHIGVEFHPAQQSDMLLALLFGFTVCIVSLGAGRLILGPKSGPLTRQQRFNGMSLALLNGFLIVANMVRYADPYLSKIVDRQTGGWTWYVPLPHITRPDGNTIALSIQRTALTVMPSPLLKIYDKLPTALILLFAFLTFVFVGTVYGRVIRGRG